MRSRSTWDQVWMDVARAVASRSACTLRQAGCVVVDQHNRVLSTGYNGPPATMFVESIFPNTMGHEATCERDCPRSQGGDQGQTNDYSNCIAVHAEANALMFGDRKSREGGCAYMWPGLSCWDCAKLLANSGVERVVAAIVSRDRARGPERVIELWRRCGLEFIEWHGHEQ